MSNLSRLKRFLTDNCDTNTTRPEKWHFPRTFYFVKIPGVKVTDYNTIPDNRFLSISTFHEDQVGGVAVGGMAL